MEEKHIFFDLDHTLWDFEANARESLIEIYASYQLEEKTGKSVHDFLKIYSRINEELWNLYRQHKIEKSLLRTKRFTDSFMELGVEERHVPNDIWDRYLEICPTKTKLLPGAKEVLDYLKANYQIHLITNGFAETQRRKLLHSKLDIYFSSLTISEEVGVQKPHPKIFSTALQNAGAKSNTGIYVGDNFEADVKGGLSSNWQTFWYNPLQNEPSDSQIRQHDKFNEIAHLEELKSHF